LDRLKRIFVALLFTTILISCTEPYALQTNTFEDVIVVEATITNEFKKQEIKLSRTYRFEDNGPEYEAGATVLVKDDLGNQYNFWENNGKYLSTSEFQAAANRTYQLFITTNDGKSYASTIQNLTTDTPIQDLVPEVATKEGLRGVQIAVKSFDPTNTSKYYRYEYEETNRITAPKWSDYDLKFNYSIMFCGAPNFPGFPSIDRVAKGNEIGKICYKTESSTDIILTSTNNLSEDRVNFPVRFISQSDYTIGERYSILVTQYVQSFQSFSFYNTLKKISGSGSVLSQNQPGFIYGNIKSTTNPNEKVIGFFDVSSVSKKRVFFNYNEIFPGEPTPTYYDQCEEFIYCQHRFVDLPGVPTYCPCTSDSPLCVGSLGLAAGPGRELRDVIPDKQMIFYNNTADIVNEFIMVKPICGDCTKVGANLKPIFWID
jgi:hypothetical protein